MNRQDYSAEMRKHQSRLMRLVYLGLGTVCLGLGILGAILPLLPTTPFILLSAACYARASDRFYNWLLNNRLFGPMIREWRRHRSIPFRVKVVSIVLMVLTLGVSIVLFVPNPYLQSALAALGIGLAVYLYRIPSRDRPVRR
ncbi:MAG: YbaN family protein [Pseudomonadota bacterium]